MFCVRSIATKSVRPPPPFILLVATFNGLLIYHLCTSLYTVLCGYYITLFLLMHPMAVNYEAGTARKKSPLGVAGLLC
jgi:hypothetical protein